jgi:hypothetical protein
MFFYGDRQKFKQNQKARPHSAVIHHNTADPCLLPKMHIVASPLNSPLFLRQAKRQKMDVDTDKKPRYKHCLGFEDLPAEILEKIAFFALSLSSGTAKSITINALLQFAWGFFPVMSQGSGISISLRSSLVKKPWFVSAFQRALGCGKLPRITVKSAQFLGLSMHAPRMEVDRLEITCAMSIQKTAPWIARVNTLTVVGVNLPAVLDVLAQYDLVPTRKLVLNGVTATAHEFLGRVKCEILLVSCHVTYDFLSMNYQAPLIKFSSQCEGILDIGSFYTGTLVFWGCPLLLASYGLGLRVRKLVFPTGLAAFPPLLALADCACAPAVEVGFQCFKDKGEVQLYKSSIEGLTTIDQSRKYYNAYRERIHRFKDDVLTTAYECDALSIEQVGEMYNFIVNAAARCGA